MARSEIGLVESVMSVERENVKCVESEFGWNAEIRAGERSTESLFIRARKLFHCRVDNDIFLTTFVIFNCVHVTFRVLFSNIY